DWSVLVNFIVNEISLDSESKLDILSKCSADRYPKMLEEQVLQSKIGRKWYRKALEKLLKHKNSHLSNRADIIQKELDELAVEAPKDETSVEEI
ncbi:MAG: hypothetical protein WCA08_11185, partial [Desulfoferrobacter sp.]